MSSGLMMDSGISGKTKLMILGGVVLAFALTIGILMRPGDATDATATAAAPQAAAQHSAQIASAAPVAAPAAPAAQAISNPQLAGSALAAPATGPADAPDTAHTGAADVPATTQPNDEVAAYAPPPAVSPAIASQDLSDWSDASIDDGDMSALGQEVAQAPVSQPRAAVRPPPPPAIDVLRPWWRDPAGHEGFDVQYVGQAASAHALVFRFSKSLANAQAAAQHIRVTDEQGEPASGVWAAGNNPYVLVYQGVSPGRYLVSIEAALASASGTELGAPRQGAVYVN